VRWHTRAPLTGNKLNPTFRADYELKIRFLNLQRKTIVAGCVGGRQQKAFFRLVLPWNKLTKVFISAFKSVQK